VFARVATFEGVDLEASRHATEAARQRLQPLLRALPGWRGLLDLADRSSGKVLSISLFDSEQNAAAAEAVFDEEMPRLLGNLIEGWAGRRTRVERYEVIFEQHATS